MSYPADCPACIAGDHNGHDAAHGTRKGLIGGNYCACTGDCAERAAAAFAKAFPVTASDARPPSDTGTTGWHRHGVPGAPGVYADDGSCPVVLGCRVAKRSPVLVVDPAEARETIARALYVAREWGGCAGAAWERVPQHVRDRYIAEADAILAALAGQEQP